MDATKIKIDRFDSQMLSFIFAIQIYGPRLKMWPIVLSSFGCFYEPAFYQPINSNLNILNLTEHALDISSPALNAPPSNFLLISRSQ